MTFQGSLNNTLHRAFKLWRILPVPSYRQALKHGVAATTEHEHVIFPRDYNTVIDVGANRGQFAVFALHRFPRARVVCFEPLPDAHEKLTEVIGRDSRVRVKQYALGSVGGRRTINVTRSDDSSSLLEPTALQIRTFSKTDTTSTVDVSVETLDNALAADQITLPFLLKIDVQGFELEVIRGACDLLKHDGDLLVECSFVELYAGQVLAGELIADLWSRGFTPAGVFGITHDATGRCLQADVLFERSVEEHTPDL